MHRVDAAGAVGERFSNGNPSTGVPGTKLEQDWHNAVQEAICQAIEAAGITLVKGDDTQLLDAIALRPVLTKSSSTGVGYTIIADTPTAVPALSATITALGDRPVQISLQHDGDTGTNHEAYIYNGGASGSLFLGFYRDGTLISAQMLTLQTTNGRMPPGVFQFVDVPAAGSHTYSVKVWNQNAGATTYFNCVVLALLH